MGGGATPESAPSSRIPGHAYDDPLDRIWLACARALGLCVVRSDEVNASTDGRGTLTLGTPATLDSDDCLAQLVFHEICHALVEGPEAFERRDWGLDNVSDADVPREQACLRLQAALAAPHGLLRFLAPTTDFRAFHDALPADPLEGDDETVVLARTGAARADLPPYAPHLTRALEATAVIAGLVAAAGPLSAACELPSLWTTVRPRRALHPGGHFPLAEPGSVRASGTCADCTWRFHGGPGRAVDRCRQSSGERVEGSWPACERHEPATTLDCRTCGACCRAGYDAVLVGRREAIVARHPGLVEDSDGQLAVKRSGDRCAALAGGVPGDSYTCLVYEDRPRCCSELEPSGVHCLAARRRVGLSR